LEYPIYSTKASSSHDIAWWEGAISEENLESLRILAMESKERGVVGDGAEGSVNSEIRRSTVTWLSYDDARELYRVLGKVVEDLNAEFFRYDLSGFKEKLQLTNYSSEDQGTYDWHMDKGHDVTRKLSLVLQLSDPNDYEGGQLEFNFGGKEPLVIAKRKGLINVFPSWAIHRVTPVTSGSRQSLVAWISGPSLK
jgi:PKHD-type hydroxylase